jgi:hypothetical protein
MNKFINKATIAFILSTVLLFSFFVFVSPEGKPLPYIFFPVVLIWIVLFSFAQIISRLLFKESSRVRTVIMFVCVSFAVLILLLSGIGQLSASDIVLASVLVIVSTFYFYRTWS